MVGSAAVEGSAANSANVADEVDASKMVEEQLCPQVATIAEFQRLVAFTHYQVRVGVQNEVPSLVRKYAHMQPHIFTCRYIT